FTVPIVAHVRPITVHSAALIDRAADLGNAVTVQSIQVDPLAQPDSLTLSYRVRGTTTFAARRMSRFGQAWIGLIPGPSVREGGVGYYVSAHNGEAPALAPAPGASAPSAFDVTPPSSAALTAHPQPTSGTVFAAGHDIGVRVNLPQGADLL